MFCLVGRAALIARDNAGSSPARTASAVCAMRRGRHPGLISQECQVQLLGSQPIVYVQHLPNPLFHLCFCIGMIDTTHPEEIVSTSWDKRPRRLIANLCDQCQGRFFAPKHLSPKFCSKDCSREAQRRRITVSCSQCHKEFKSIPSSNKGSKSGLRFCQRSCKDEAQRLEGLKALHPPHYGRDCTHRKALIRDRGHKCEVCKFTEWQGQPIPLQVDHIDGNPYDHTLTNLRLICPNCHIQTPTWGGRNRGRGRKSRKHPGWVDPLVE